jgi:hypothetical protein
MLRASTPTAVVAEETACASFAIRLTGASMSPDDASLRLAAADVRVDAAAKAVAAAFLTSILEPKHRAPVAPPRFPIQLHRTATPNPFDGQSMSPAAACLRLAVAAVHAKVALKPTVLTSVARILDSKTAAAASTPRSWARDAPNSDPERPVESSCAVIA